MTRKIIAAGVAALGALGLAACGSASSATPAPAHAAVPAAHPSAPSVGPQVLAIINEGNAAVTKDRQIKDETAADDAIASAFSSAASKLRGLSYPASATGDAKALEAVLDKLAADVTQLATDTVSDASEVDQDIVSDEATEAADSDALRSDLGLPAAAVGSSAS
ncbi:MAG TPA: hypothetical protein VF288_10570 [Mycobacteriales bacterium]